MGNQFHSTVLAHLSLTSLPFHCSYLKITKNHKLKWFFSWKITSLCVEILYLDNNDNKKQALIGLKIRLRYRKKKSWGCLIEAKVGTEVWQTAQVKVTKMAGKMTQPVDNRQQNKHKGNAGMLSLWNKSIWHIIMWQHSRRKILR